MSTGRDDFEMWAKVTRELASAVGKRARQAGAIRPSAETFLLSVGALLHAGADTLEAIIRMDAEEAKTDAGQ